MEARVTLKYFVNYCPQKHFLDSNLAQTPLTLISLTFLVVLSLFPLFESKIRAIKIEKSPKICLTW